MEEQSSREAEERGSHADRCLCSEEWAGGLRVL